MKLSLRSGSIAAGIALLIAFGIWFILHRRGAPQRAAVTSREVATRVLAEYIAQRAPGKPVLVISNPFTQKSGRNPQIYAFEEAAISGLRKGFGSTTLMKIGFPELRPEAVQNPSSVYVDPKTTTPLSFFVGEDSFDKVARENPDCETIVTLIGLPVSLQKLEVWKKPGDPKFALLLPDWRFIGTKEAVQGAVKSGKIIAAVVNKPGAPPESLPVKDDYKAEFAKRFLLVTAENIDQLLQTNPQLF